MFVFLGFFLLPVVQSIRCKLLHIQVSSLQALELPVFGSKILHQILRYVVSRSAVCVGEAPRSYVPAPAAGWKRGKCLQMS